jgi:PIN domain nuclease of toxin-antitoxin system
VKLLLDTQLLLWAAGDPDRLPAAARALIEGLTLVTGDDKLDGYPGSILKV